MAKIITIDTSTNVCSVALHDNGELLSSKINHKEKSHSKYVTLMVEEVVGSAGFQLNEIDAFAISKGPGSYTGLRIGVATVKGYCFALDKPMLSINTLDGMWEEQKLKHKPSYYVPMIDARRMEVYTKVFDSSGTIIETEAKILDEASFNQFTAKGETVFFGDGSEKFNELIGEKENYVFIENVFPNAEFMGKKVYELYKSESFEDLAYFEPYYLKDFLATTPKKQLL